LAQHGATIIGVTALADGADQIFARAVVDQGGGLEVIVPAAGYREGLPTESHEEYNDLLDQALKVHHRIDLRGAHGRQHPDDLDDQRTGRRVGPAARPRPREAPPTSSPTPASSGDRYESSGPLALPATRTRP
jgi:hypothetical protein